MGTTSRHAETDPVGFVLNVAPPNPALQLRPITPLDKLPSDADVVVVGGGIVGVATAWHLAQRGLRVVVCEKGAISGEQSGRNWGWCRNTLRDPREIPLMKISMADWRDRDVFGKLETGFRTTGIIYLTGRRPDDDGDYDAWLQSIAAYGLDSHMLSRRQVSELLPGCRRVPQKGALYTPSDGCAEPGWAAPAIAADAQRQGASIHTHCAVRGLETQAGRISAVVTEQGEIRCGGAVLAAGSWSRLFAGNLGLGLPSLNVRGSVMYTRPMPGGPEVSVVGRRFGWRKRADGGYIISQADATIFDIVPDCFKLFGAYAPTLAKSLKQLRLRLGSRFIEELKTPGRWSLDERSPFEEVRSADPAPSAFVLSQAASNLAASFPFFKEPAIEGSWGGYIDVTPDQIPIIGRSSSIDGLVFATGFSGHGFGLGPGGGRLAADIVSGATPCTDPAAFRPARFGL